MAYILRARRGTTAAYAALNRIYAEGEILAELGTDGNYRLKVADGSTAYNALPYVLSGEGAGPVPAFGTIAVPGQSSLVAETQGDTLTFVASSGISATTSAASDQVTIAPLYGTSANTVCQGNDVRLGASGAHATTHKTGGSDPIRIDELAAAQDNTNLNASTGAHGLLRKLTGSTSDYLRADGTWTAPSTSAMPFVNVQDYGALGDDSTLNDAAFAAAIAAGVGRVYFPGGIYRVASSVVLDKWGVYFGDKRGTTIRTTSATGNVFSVTAPGTVVRDITFDSSVTRTGGAYVIITAPLVVVESFDMYGGYTGVRVTTGATALVTIQNANIRDTVATGTCIHLESGDSHTIRDITIDQVPPCAVGISIESTEEVTIEDCDIIRCGVALSIWPAPGKNVAAVYANNTFFDNSVLYGMQIIADATSVMRCTFDQCWFSSSGLTGARLGTLNGGVVSGVDFHQCTMILNAGDGIRIENSGVSSVGIIGGAFAQNGGAGISVGQNVAKFIINGVASGATHFQTGNGYGIFIDTGCNSYVVNGNIFLGNTSANIIDAGTTPKVVANNLS